MTAGIGLIAIVGLALLAAVVVGIVVVVALSSGKPKA
jgi:hypothetical protein